MNPFKKTLQLAAIFLGIINAKEIPIADGKVNFSPDQEATIKNSMSEETMKAAIEKMNNEIAANEDVKNLESQIQATLKELNDEEKTGANAQKEKVPGEEEEAFSAEDALKQISALTKEKDALIAKMMKTPEIDTPLQKLLNTQAKEAMKHSKTHLFASGKDFDAFEGRNWNQLAIGKSTNATEWTASEGVNISRLNGDMELFFRENPDVIKSLHRDNFGLPAHWKKKYGVVDRINSGSIATAEIGQTRKLNWAPKNKQTIQAEEGYVYPTSIDIEFVGHFLSDIEASWLSNYNKEGSQAYKLTFVRFLVAELDKKARLEDRVATMKGVFVPTPDHITKPGRSINKQNGLLYWIWKARDITKKYRAFNLGTPTSSNIVDYVDMFLKSLPLDVRTSQGLELNLSKAWLDTYKTRYGLLHAGDNNYTGPLPHPKDFENVKFVKNVDMEGLDFMFITFSDNIEILENLPKEKSLYTFEYFLRKIYAFADYKLGIRLIHIGNIVKDGDPAEFKVQTIWSNNVPIFPAEFYAPIFDDSTGVINATFNQLVVDDAWATEITDVKGLAPGVIFKLQGDTALAATKNVTTSGNLDLASNFDLKSGGTLSLIVLEDGSLKELSRTTAPVTVPTVTATTFDSATIDAAEGKEHSYVGSAAVTITEILNGVQSQQVKIFGKAGAGSSVTINTVGNIKTASSAVLAVATDFIELVLIDGVWTEFNRDIAA